MTAVIIIGSYLFTASIAFAVGLFVGIHVEEPSDIEGDETWR